MVALATQRYQAKLWMLFIRSWLEPWYQSADRQEAIDVCY